MILVQPTGHEWPEGIWSGFLLAVYARFFSSLEHNSVCKVTKLRAYKFAKVEN